MSDPATIRAAIASTLLGVDGIGLVHRYERYAKRNEDLKALYVDGGQLLGWHIRRVSTRESSEELGRWVTVHVWEIKGFRAIEDGEASELAFDDLVEDIRTEFRAHDTLAGAVDSCIVGQEAGIQVRESGPVLFAGVLCHYVRLGLNTRVYL